MKSNLGSHLTPEERVVVNEALLLLYHHMQDVLTAVGASDPPLTVHQAFASVTSPYINRVDEIQRRLREEAEEEEQEECKACSLAHVDSDEPCDCECHRGG